MHAYEKDLKPAAYERSYAENPMQLARNTKTITISENLNLQSFYNKYLIKSKKL